MLASLLYKIIAGIGELLLRALALSRKLDDVIAIQKLHTEMLARILAAVELLPAVGIEFDVVLEGQTQTGVVLMIIKDTQKFTASIRPVDAKGNPAQVQSGSIQWSGPDFLTVTPASDGLSAEVSANGPLGSGQVAVSADADLGDGVVTITGVLQVEVQAGQAVSLAVDSSQPTEQ